MVHVVVTLRTGLCCALLPQALQETEVDTTFVLPASAGGGEEQAVFRMGHTVAFLKEHVQQCCQVEVHELVFVLEDGTTMIDPLTLTDYPQIDHKKGVSACEGEGARRCGERVSTHT